MDPSGGDYGLSMWGAVGSRSLESVLAGKCKFSRWVALNRAADLRVRGLGIVPSGVAPHYDATVSDASDQDFGSVHIIASSAEELIDRFLTATCTEMQNEHFTTRPS